MTRPELRAKLTEKYPDKCADQIETAHDERAKLLAVAKAAQNLSKFITTDYDPETGFDDADKLNVPLIIALAALPSGLLEIERT